MSWIKKLWISIKTSIVTPDPYDELPYHPLHQDPPVQRMLEKLSFNGYHVYSTDGYNIYMFMRFREYYEVEAALGEFVSLNDMIGYSEFVILKVGSSKREQVLGVTDNDGQVLYLNEAVMARLLDGISNYHEVLTYMNPDLEPWIDYYINVLKHDVKGSFSV